MKRRFAIVVAVLALLAVIGAVALHLAASALRAEVVAALGPESEAGAITLGFGRVEIESLRVRAPAGWPAPDTLRARRVVVTPDMRTLFSSTVRVSRVTIEQGYLSMVRARDGRVRVLPASVRGAAPVSRDPGAAGAGSGPGPGAARDTMVAHIDRLELRDCALEFFDESVRRPALKVAVSDLAVDLENLLIPSLGTRSRLRVAGTVRGAPRDGAPRDGTLSVNGWIVLATRDSELETRLRAVDLVALQPYLIRAADTAVRSGLLDLDLSSTISAGRVQAPGVLTLTGLELASTGSGAATFMGLPRQAVLALMKDGRDRITLKFSLSGRLDDPRFSLSEDLAARAAASLAQELGVSFEGVVRGLGGAGGRGAEAAGEAARSLGSALKGLFGR